MQIGELTFDRITFDSTVAKLCIRGLSGLAKLHTLGLQRVQLDQKLVNALPDLALNSKVRIYCIKRFTLCKAKYDRVMIGFKLSLVLG